MKIPSIISAIIDWENIPSEKADGSLGFSISKMQQAGEIKIRNVEYSDNFLSDHWCQKGHIIFVIEGELTIEYKDGNVSTLKKGMSYMVGDNVVKHRAKTVNACNILIID